MLTLHTGAFHERGGRVEAETGGARIEALGDRQGADRASEAGHRIGLSHQHF